MLYVAIDQHAKQITVAIRNAQGEDVLKRQASTRREKIKQFFDQVVAMDSQFMAILESCGFNDWLLEELHNRKCRRLCSFIQKGHRRRKPIDETRTKALRPALVESRTARSRQASPRIAPYLHRNQERKRRSTDHFVASGSRAHDERECSIRFNAFCIVTT